MNKIENDELEQVTGGITKNLDVQQNVNARNHATQTKDQTYTALKNKSINQMISGNYGAGNEPNDGVNVICPRCTRHFQVPGAGKYTCFCGAQLDVDENGTAVSPTGGVGLR